ncbi:hypothetical protein GCM10009530_37200 [Microbispora corallina]|uniref:Uncharacterized protein n=1 Tax=Microbispora corallina TaxID=83302 RepID=A0ABQ4G283_9ACTN|nr:hypothetical protein Mco01_41690 [Microbispora corallina]
MSFQIRIVYATPYVRVIPWAAGGTDLISRTGLSVLVDRDRPQRKVYAARWAVGQEDAGAVSSCV